MGSNRDNLITAMAIFIAVDGAAMAARLYVRTKLSSQALGWDDFALCFTFVGYLAMCAMCFVAMVYGFAADDVKPCYDAVKAKQFYFANQTICYVISGLVKLAIALVLFRLAATRPLRWLLVTSMVVVFAWTVVMTLYSSWLCATSGASNYAGSKTCMYVGYFRTISNMTFDYFYAFLPIYMLWKVQMSFRLKATAVILLGLGIVASSAGIVKLVILVKLETDMGTVVDDLHYELLLWADVELGLSIFAASAAALRPLF